MKHTIQISTDKSLLNTEMIFDYLSNRSYWAKGRSIEVVRNSIENSFCFGIYDDKEQIGFARVVTDYAIFAWVMDVFILEKDRGEGYGKALMHEVRNHPKLNTVVRWGLCTDDAHELYKQFGFATPQRPEIMMELIVKPS